MSAASEAIEMSTDEAPAVPSDKTLKAYEAQFLGFTPVTLINGMFNSVCDFYREALKAFCASCEEQCPGVMSEEDMKIARRAVSQKIDHEISNVFDRLEMFALRNIFAIPDDCILQEDMCQLNYEPSAGDDVENKIRDIKKKIIAVKYANAVLIKRLESAEAFKNVLDKALVGLNDLKHETNKDVNIKDVLSYFSDTVMTAFGKNVK